MGKHFVAVIALLAVLAIADNPIVQTYFAPDPAPMVYNDTVFVYTGHDEDITVDNFFTMHRWRVYSSTDMVNWTDRGAPLSHQDFSWAGDKAWAAQAIERNGKFYWYVTAGLKGSNQPAIGVAVGDSPVGPFHDPIDKPLIKRSWDEIDPTVYIDTDGQAYLYWGNPNLYYVKLNEDMISYNGSIQNIPMTTEAFGVRHGDDNRETTYEEGPWFYKRNSLYYMVYATGPLPEKIGYSTATGPTGPWKYGGEIMGSDGIGSFTIHPGVIDFKGRSYLFYHTGNLPNGGGYKRAVSVEEFSYGADGSIPRIKPTKSGPEPVANLNPFKRVEAECMAFSRGLKTTQNSSVGIYVNQIHNDDYIKLRSVDFSTQGADTIFLSISTPENTQGGTIDVVIDSSQNIASINIPKSNNSAWQLLKFPIKHTTGVHDLFFNFKSNHNSELFHFDYWYVKSNIPDESLRQPFKEVLTVPGLIQAEDFDIGGQGLAYSDNDPENQGGEYRDEGVDITTDNEGNYVVGWTEVGEWLSYSINVDSTAKYLWEARVSSAMDNSSFKIFVDDKDVSGNIAVPNTDSWDSYVTINGTTENISAGKHILKISITGAFVNIDWLKFSDLNTVSIIKNLPAPIKTPIKYYNLKGQFK
ncbi:MAG: family 43 glycosylhydrolase [Fibrobacter sp.]|nr:family 43 glycosylhydrolase [Fibrobacter sp.]